MDKKIFTSLSKAQTNIIAKKFLIIQAWLIELDASKSNLNICALIIINAIYLNMTSNTLKIRNFR